MLRRLLSVAPLIFAMVACGSDGGYSSGQVSINGTATVFAASSLTEAFGEEATAFHAAYPNAKVTFSFAGSNDLARQIKEGAPADAFAAADAATMDDLAAAGGTTGTATAFASNQMEIIVETGNPKGIATLADLAKPDLVVVLCADTVPCGKSAQKVLAKAGVTVNPRSFEDKVKGVVTKVTAGEADAGIVFATDVQAAGSRAAGVPIPANVNVTTTYQMAVTKQATNAATATAFIDFVASDAGQAILAKYGFGTA